MSISVIEMKNMCAKKSYKNKLSKKKAHARSTSKPSRKLQQRKHRRTEIRKLNKSKRIKLKNGINKGDIELSGEVPYTDNIWW